MLNVAVTLDDLRMPAGNRFEKLRGDRTRRHRIRIDDQWRLCFERRDGAAHAIEIVDDHRGGRRWVGSRRR